MTDIDRGALVQVIELVMWHNGMNTGQAPAIANAILDHLRATAHPATAGAVEVLRDLAAEPIFNGGQRQFILGYADAEEDRGPAAPPTPATDGLRERIEALCETYDAEYMAQMNVAYRSVVTDLRAALAATPTEPGDGPLRVALDDVSAPTLGYPENLPRRSLADLDT